MSAPAAGRTTRQREAIARALEGAGGFKSAQELHQLLRKRGERVGLTTVYRELQRLTDAGRIDALSTGAGETMYRRCNSGEHHHHLVCRSCGASVEIAGEEIEEWAARTARSHGFSDVHHVAELFGICGSCGRPGKG